MNISIAICTWNRAALLERTLEGVSKLEIPSGMNWELIVVNNNCSDHTDTVIAKYQRHLPLKRIFEPAQGLSHARNAALDAALGTHIIWTDDDVLVDPQWLCAYALAFQRWPDAKVFGGKVLPWFESDPPYWLRENLQMLGGYYALRDFGDDERELGHPDCPYGANLAFRTEALKKYRFNPNLGRKGNNLSGGEETEIINKLREGGAQVVWVSGSIVQHFLPTSRMTLRYLREYHFCLGKYQSPKRTPTTKTIMGFPPWMLKRWFSLEIRYLLQRYTGTTPQVWLTTMIQASEWRGQLVSAYLSQRALPN